MSSLPLLQGYPVVFSISQDCINNQFTLMARDGQMPGKWNSTGSDWLIDAEVASPFIGFDSDFPNDIGLNFPVTKGVFKALVQKNGGVGWQVYDITGVIFRFLTPTNEMHEDTFRSTDLNGKALFINLNSPHLNTIVETSKAIETVMPDDIKVKLATRVQDYVRGLAKENPNQFVISSSLVENAAAVNARGGQSRYFSPTAADYSTFIKTDASVKPFTPGYSSGSCINWLLCTPAYPHPTEPTAGHFDSIPLPGGEQAAMLVAGQALVDGIVNPVLQRMRSSHISYNVYPNGDHIQVDFHFEVTKTKHILFVKESVTATADWSSYIKFNWNGSAVVPQVTSSKPRTHISGKTSILGIHLPSFVDGMLTKIATSIAGGFSFGAPALSAIANYPMSAITVLGGNRFQPHTAYMKDGNLVMGLTVNNTCSSYPPSEESKLRSTSGAQAVDFFIRNAGVSNATVYWIDYKGKAERWGTCAPGQTFHLTRSYVTHVWSIHNDQGQCIALFRIDRPDSSGKATFTFY